MKFINFLFCKSYKLALQLGNEGFYPEVKAWFIATLLPWLNLLSILIVLKNSFVISKEIFLYLLIGSSLFWIIGFFSWVINENYVKILSNQDGFFSKNKYSNLLFYGYLFITFIIYFWFLDT